MITARIPKPVSVSCQVRSYCILLLGYHLNNVSNFASEIRWVALMHHVVNPHFEVKELGSSEHLAQPPAVLMKTTPYQCHCRLSGDDRQFIQEFYATMN